MRDKPRRLLLVASAAFAVVIAAGAAYTITRDSSTHGTMRSAGGMEGMDHSGGMALETDGKPYDQAFIDNMVPHHEGAVEMARIELAKGEREDVKKLAARIVSTQNNEIARMQAWRDEWYGDSATPAEMPMSMPGMDIDSVRRANDVDRAFVEMMIPHHESAIAMAMDARTKGTHARIRELAAAIVTDQVREVARMKTWTESW